MWDKFKGVPQFINNFQQQNGFPIPFGAYEPCTPMQLSSKVSNSNPL